MFAGSLKGEWMIPIDESSIFIFPYPKNLMVKKMALYPIRMILLQNMEFLAT
jgi:hypothetical protein